MDLLVAEDDWVRREFDDIVAAEWGGSGPTSPRTQKGAHEPRRSGPRSRPSHDDDLLELVVSATRWAHQRGPPGEARGHNPGSSPISPCTTSYVDLSAAATSPSGTPCWGWYGDPSKVPT